MSTGGNERETTGGETLTFDMVLATEQAMAQVLRFVSAAKGQLSRMPISVDVTGGAGAEITKAVQAAAEKARFNWQAIAKPEELRNLLREVEPELQRLAVQAESAGKAIHLAISGAGGSGNTYAIKSVQDVAGVLSALQSHGNAMAGRGGEVTMRAGLGFSPTGQGISDAASVKAAMDLAGEQHATRQRQARDELDTTRLRIMDDKQAAKDLAGEQKQYEKGQLPGWLKNLSTYGGTRGLNSDEQRAEEGRVSSLRENITARYAKQADDAAKAARATESAAKQLSYWEEAIKSWGSGGRPQRSMSAMATGALTPMLGDTMGPLMGGIAGMIGGGAMFHIGWEITNALSKLPGAIAGVVAENQQIAVQQASLTAGAPGGFTTPGKVSAASMGSEFQALIAGPSAVLNRAGSGTDLAKNYADAFATLQTEAAKRFANDPQARAAWTKTNSEFAFTAAVGQQFAGTGDAAGLASTMQALKMNQDVDAAKTLLNTKGLPQRLIEQYRAAGKISNAIPNAQAWDLIQSGLLGQTGMQSPSAKTRQAASENILQAVEGMIQGAPQTAGFSAAMKQWHPGTGMMEGWQSLFGSDLHLTGRELAGMNTYARQRETMSRAEAEKWATTIDSPDKSVGVSGQHIPISAERLQQLSSSFEAYAGNPQSAMGGPAQPFALGPIGTPQFSFSSLSEYANKMQREAGIQVSDPNEATAKNTGPDGAIVTTLKALIKPGAQPAFGPGP